MSLRNPNPDDLIDFRLVGDKAAPFKYITFAYTKNGNLYTPSNNTDNHADIILQNDNLWAELFPQGLKYYSKYDNSLRTITNKNYYQEEYTDCLVDNKYRKECLLGRINEDKKYVSFWNASPKKPAGVLLKGCLLKLLQDKSITLKTIVCGDVPKKSVEEVLGGAVLKPLDISKYEDIHLKKTKDKMQKLGLTTGGKVAPTWRNASSKLGVNYIGDHNLNFREFMTEGL